MRCESKERPELIQQRHNGYAIRYNLNEVVREEEAFWQYDEVIVPSLEHNVIVEAIIREKYRIEEQVDILGEAIDNPGSSRYLEYKKTRQGAMTYCTETLGY